MRKTVTIARGDGIGPEIMQATLDVLSAAGAELDYEEIQIGRAVYERGIKSGIEPEAWDSLRRTKVFLKAPITTPQGGGFKSLNVTVRKTLGLFANVRPCVSYAPYVETRHPKMDLVIVRENEEDLYGGIEYRPTADVTEAVKLISRPGCERIVRYAFEYARAHGRKKVTCMTKDNIMKLSDGLFHKVFDEIAAEYPDIEKDHYIIDIGSARLANAPHIFDVIVTLNLYGDIISDIAAEITGSVGLGGSANIGAACSMFEAIHGSAPDIAGKGIANPSGLMLAAVMMLVHLGENGIAAKIHNAWLKTLEDGMHTGDLYRPNLSAHQCGTTEFARAVIDRLGQKPEKFAPVDYGESREGGMPVPEPKELPPPKKILVGIDAFVEWAGEEPEALAKLVQEHIDEDLVTLRAIDNRGVKVWPDGLPETFCTRHWRLRIVAADDVEITPQIIYESMGALVEAGLEVTAINSLFRYDGANGFSDMQGE